MCLVVIQDHFLTDKLTVSQKFVGYFGSLAVPCFMFLSFYFMAKDLQTLNKERLKNRLCRLYVPVLFWSMIYFICINAGAIITGRDDLVVGLRGLLINLMFSHYSGLTTHMWFMIAQIVDLILIVIVFLYVEKKEKRILALLTMLVVTFVLEYSGVAFYLFDTAPYETRYPLGRSIECIPYAVGGIIYAWCIHKREMKIKIPVWLGCMILTALSIKFIPSISGFGYNGFFLMIGAISICIFAINLPDVIHGRLRLIINWLGTYTMGIYCLHLLIGYSLNILLPDKLFQGTLIFDGIIFVIGIIGTWFVKLISRKLGWKWLVYVA